MSRIILLDENTANRIAAGEVVERPASAAKELVENALDAGATRITVRMEDGGRALLSVADNGYGMTRDEAVLALQRHATSKIRTAEDLFRITTLGFRGEALPSIASVSRLILSTRAEGAETGVRIEVTGGTIVADDEVSMAFGTVVEVHDLFYNTPARLKFMRSPNAEASRTGDLVAPLALAYPNVAFRILAGQREMLRTSGQGDMLAAIAALWTPEIGQRLIPVHDGAGSLYVSGYVGPPDVSRPGRSHQLVFVNGRAIRSRTVTHALEEAFRSLSPEGRFPVAVLFIAVDNEQVDVNVHPTKSEVRFTRDSDIHHAVSTAVKAGLLKSGIVSQLGSGAMRTGFSGDWLKAERYTGDPGATAQAELRFPVADASALGGSDRDPFAVGQSDTSSSSNGDATGPAKPYADQLRSFRVLGQARNTYIVAATADGLAIIDQHVAHERVLYERLTEKRFGAGIPSQQLAVPWNLALERREAVIVGDNLDQFARAGWDIAPFGKEAFIVRAVPTALRSRNAEAILRDTIDELVNQSVSRRLLVERDVVTITNACKMAVKAGDPLTVPEMESLLEQLADTENPWLCPHGRPIVVTIPFASLDRQFKRS